MKRIALLLVLFALILGGLASCNATEMKQSPTKQDTSKNEKTNEGNPMNNAPKEIEQMTKGKEIYLAGGCFWGVQKYFDQFDGVLLTEVGYSNGPVKETTYEEVCRGNGSAETLRIMYDEKIISLTELLDYYFLVIDPVSVNQQGNDRGVQYRTGIYYSDEAQIPEIEQVYQKVEKEVGQKLAVEVEAVKNYWPAEDYHQKYLDKNPGGYCHIPRELFNLAKKEKNSEPKADDWKEESPEERRKRIGDEAFEITQNAKTERAFTGQYDNFYEKGIYVDIVSGEALFSSEDKFDVGCGWPSFSKPIEDSVLKEFQDTSFGMIRTEVKSKEADSHLGHVFEDGPQELGGLRYCINSASLRFIPYEDLVKEGYGEYKKLFED